MDVAAFWISIVAVAIALGAAWYTRQQAVTAERARALDHDAAFRVAWSADVVDAEFDKEAGEWRLERDNPHVLIENIGRGTAFDLTISVAGVEYECFDAPPKWSRRIVEAEPGDRIELRWRSSDGTRAKHVVKSVAVRPQL